MKTKITLALILVVSLLNAQHQNDQWVFGNSCHVSFESGNPENVVFNPYYLCLDNAASIADPISGELLFFSNGYEVFNASLEVMENGDGLLGHNSGGTCAFAIQQPGSSSLYYLFTSDAWAGSNGIRYSIIDMEMDGGLGAVTDVKNEVLLNYASEKIVAIPHANGIDSWIVVHPYNSGTYFSYLLSANGLASTPVESEVGVEHIGGTSGTYNAAGQIVVNEQFNMIAAAIFDEGVVDLLDFNNATGEFSNSRVLEVSKAWGVAFSPNGELLYVSHWGGASKGNIEQFDVSFETANEIQSTQSTMGELTGPNGSYIGGYLMLAPNDKIYIAKYLSTELAVIEFPNEYGISCDLNDEGFVLEGVCQAGLPNRIHVKSSTVGISQVVEQNNLGLEIYPNPTSGYFVCSSAINADDLKIEIFDAMGKMVYQEQSSITKSSWVIHTSAWPKGTYVVQVKGTTSFATGRVVVN